MNSDSHAPDSPFIDSPPVLPVRPDGEKKMTSWLPIGIVSVVNLIICIVSWIWFIPHPTTPTADEVAAAIVAKIKIPTANEVAVEILNSKHSDGTTVLQNIHLAATRDIPTTDEITAAVIAKVEADDGKLISLFNTAGYIKTKMDNGLKEAIALEVWSTIAKGLDIGDAGTLVLTQEGNKAEFVIEPPAPAQ